jgi:hypothetical protein
MTSPERISWRDRLSSNKAAKEFSFNGSGVANGFSISASAASIVESVVDIKKVYPV